MDLLDLSLQIFYKKTALLLIFNSLLQVDSVINTKGCMRCVV